MRVLNTIIHWDQRTFYWCMRRKHQALLTSISRKISFSADGHLYVAIALLFLLSGTPAHVHLCQVFVSAFLIERAIYWLMKNSLKRDRPAQSLPNFHSFIVPSDQFSFPSGHTSAAFLMATLLASVYPGLAFAFYLWAVSVAGSRVLLGVHFPTDTLVGALLGHVIGLVAIVFLGINV